ncbi:MAG: TlpA family protein disulfide reductase [Spirochaetes bacterium]|nr:TlpA family protein disulfide reductase [Spirochaetota bacterium]
MNHKISVTSIRLKYIQFPIMLFFFLIFSFNIHSETSTAVKAPDFSLFDTDQKVVRLSKFKGNVVVLNFFATWCPPCRMEIPSFVKIAKKYKEKDVRFLGIILENPYSEKKVKSFIKENKINYPVLQGNKDVIISYGGIRAIPTTFIVDQKGLIIEHHVGYLTEEKLKEIIDKTIETNKVKDKKNNAKKEK